MRFKLLFIAFAVTAACIFGPPASPAFAMTAVSGRVVDQQGHPQSGAIVSLAGANRTVRTTSGATGAFEFVGVSDGEYDLSASGQSGVAAAHLVVSATDVNVILKLAPRSLGRVNVTSNYVLRSGGSAVITGSQLAHSPASNSLSNVFLQLPSAARGSNGQIHINGDHGDINYFLDGVPLPQELNRVIGSEVDPSDVGFLDVVEGAFPAKYGGKFGAVVNIATVAGTGSPGGMFETTVGTYGHDEMQLLQHDRFGRGGGITVALRTARGGWALDPPVQNPTHDLGSTSNAFVRVTVPSGRYDSLNVDISHAYQTFQVPPDTSNGTPASTDDVETQNDSFLALNYIHPIGSRGTLTFGPTVKISSIRDFPDLAHDFAAAPGDNCSGASPNAPSSCLFAARTNRLARDIGAFATYSLSSSRHLLETGATYDIANVQKLYDIFLQPDNYLNPGSTVPTQIVDNAPNVAHSSSVYAQDGWQMSRGYRVDYGLRYDEFTIFSTDFKNGFSQVSPRIKLTRVLSDRTALYVYYGRLFTPFSFENVSPAVAAQINPSSGLAFDLLPARESLYEVGGVFALGSARASWKIAHKSLVNVLDDAQVGATNIHQDINFGDGSADFQVLMLQFPHDDGSRDYVTFTHSRAVNRGCGSQLLSGCAPPPYDFFDADHDQRWDGSFGKEFRLAGSRWLTLTSEYGSGLSTGTSCDACKVPSHWTFDAQLGSPVGERGTMIFAVRNLLNDKYAITINSSLQGTHYAQPRSLDVSFREAY
jgi:hypothetical protein